MNKKIILIFIFAFLIRLIALNQSLWLDEAVTANVVKNFGVTQIINKFSPTDFHPPLYYLFIKIWTNFFGYSEIALRMPSVLFSLATGYFVYLIGGIWAAVFFLFNPLIIYYSQEARMYMVATFLLTVSLFYLIKMLQNQKSLLRQDFGGQAKIHIRNQILFGIFISLAFLTFYGSVFLIFAMFLYLLFKKQYKVFFVSCSLLLVSFALVSPLLYQQFINSKIALTSVANWSAVLGKSNIKNLLLIPIKFSIGRISFYPKWLYWAIAGGWTGYLIYQISKINPPTGGQNNKSKFKIINTLFYLFLFPLFLGFLVSFFIPMLQYFRFLYLIPIVCLLLGFGLLNQASSNLRGSILAGGFLFLSLVYLLLPQFHREDWKRLVVNLPKNKPVYMITASSDPVTYYLNSLKVSELTSLSVQQAQDKRVSELEKEIVVIPYTVEIYGYDYKKELKEKSYILNKTTTFRELFFEEWKKP